MRKKISSLFILFLLVSTTGIFYHPSVVLASSTPDFETQFTEKDNINIYKASVIPSDPYFDKQWYLKRIKALETWDEHWDANKIIIAIIDSGVQINHPDLKDNVWTNIDEIYNNGKDDDGNGFIDDRNGWDFVENNSDPNPKYDKDYTKDGIMHGTVVAGVAAAGGNNFIGVTGVAWNAKIMPLRVLNGKGEGNTKSVVRAIDYAIKNGADIINLSFVGVGYSSILEEAIKRAYNAGIVIIAAAGNDMEGDSSHFLDKEPLYPVCYDGKNGENMVIGVAATDSLDQKANFSGYGSRCIDISAPGISIFSTAVTKPGSTVFNNNYDGYWAGTSMAVPMVSGAVALIEAANPHLSRSEVVSALLKNTDNIDNLNPNFVGKLGTGRLNIYASMNSVIEISQKKSVNFVISPLSGKNGEVLLTDRDGKILNKFLAFGDNYHGGTSITTGDVSGDGLAEIIVGAGTGSAPQIKIFNAEGVLKKEFLAYDKNFKGGVSVSVADVDADGFFEIITGAGVGGGPHVRIYNYKGELKRQFFAYDKNFRGGVNVAAGDVDGDGFSEIVTGAGVGGGPQVRIFKNNGQLKGQYFAYDKKFRGGVNVAVGTFNDSVRNASSMIITAPGKGGGPQIRIFDNHFKLHGQFFAYAEQFKGGVGIFLADVDKDGQREIITGAGPGGAPHIRAFDDNGTLVSSFYAYEESFNGGVSVSAIEL